MIEIISNRNETMTPDGGKAIDPQIHVFSTGEEAILANAYLVELPSGLVAIDGTLTVSTSKALRVKLDQIRKPLLAVLVTHGHPDHYNGIANVMGKEKVPLYSTAGVNEVIRKYDEAKEKQWTPMFGKEWPAARLFPDHILKNGESVVFDGVRFTVFDLGPGESHQDSYWMVEGANRYAFIGDEVLNGVHAYVADGHTTQWLKNLERLKVDLAQVKKIFPGYGAAGGLDLLDWQMSYLKHYREAVQTLARGKSSLDDLQKKKLEKEMRKYLPDGRLVFLIALGADAVAEELSQQQP
jgi:glyoxylase-like metal-dependent hydrolase (beta-lactamase superfamily II)